ncbi:MAG: sigma-54 dependent transcriptional regulator [Nannocystaceae bacterium]
MSNGPSPSHGDDRRPCAVHNPTPRPRRDASADLSGTILIVDDERNIRRTLRMVLEGEGAAVREAATAEEALAMLAGPSRNDIDVLVVDVRLPGISGIELLRRLAAEAGDPKLPVILISGHASMSDAVHATRLGAFDFFEKPLSRERIVVGVRNALRVSETERQLQELRGEVYGEVTATSDTMCALLARAKKVGRTTARVLITGESGSGKELIARTVHAASERSTRPFVKVNCAAIPRELIESELFGHERGAFTGAEHRKPGLFEMADRGTILLDEIGDMDLGAQAKVLRVLEDGEMMRVGGENPVKVDVRVLASTHHNLVEQVKNGAFREDLFFRLNVIPLEVPPLRSRPADIAPLVGHFIAHTCRSNGFALRTIEPAALDALTLHPWPGNVRELRNIVERMVVLSDGDLTLADVPEEVLDAGANSGPGHRLEAQRLMELLQGKGRAPLKVVREAMERLYINEQLRANNWNVSRTAQVLGLERSHLHRKIKLLQIRRGET